MDSEEPPNARRTVLKTLGGAAGLASIGIGAASSPAAAAPGDGDQSSGDVVASEGLSLTVDPENGDDSNDGSESNPLATIQEADNRAPFINPGHQIRVNLEPGTYDEVPVIGPCMSGGAMGRPYEIIGDADNPEEYRVNSLCINNVSGCNGITVRGLTFLTESDDISDGAACWVFGNSTAHIDSCRFEPDDGESFEAGIEAYDGANVKATGNDVSNCQHGIKAKRMSDIWAKDTAGSADEYVYWATERSDIGYWHEDSSPSGGEDIVRSDNGSQVLNRSGEQMG